VPADFITDVTQTFVDTPARVAISPPRQLSDVERAELDWSRANPWGGAGQPSDNPLVLWNFDVAKANLKAEHIAALRGLVAAVEGLPGLGVASYNGTFVVTGYASRTGTETVNTSFGQFRAAAVQTWLTARGFRTVIGQSGGIDDTGAQDGEALARARRVEISRLDAATPPSTPPDWMIPPATDGSLICAGIGTVNIDLDFAELGIWQFPPPPQIVGKVVFVGKVRLVFDNPEMCQQVALTLNVLNPGGTKIDKQISDAVRARLSLSATPGSAPVAASLLFGGRDLQWELGVQAKPDLLFLKAPAIPMASDLSLDFGVAKARLRLLGQFQASIGPGPALVEPVKAWVAGLGLTVGEAAALVTALVIPPLVMYLMIDEIGTADAAGLRRASLLASRLGFAAEVAISVGTAGSDALADTMLQSYGEPRLKQMKIVVGVARRTAVTQMSALAADAKSKLLSHLTDTYGVNANGAKDLDYFHVAVRMFSALGGTSPTGDMPSLSLL